MSATPRISLCMICGNEAAVIRDCLDSAAAAFDQLCLVRAVGEQAPDNTFDIASKWCLDHGIQFVCAEYRNSIPGLPHVDNFAAARNMSFDLANNPFYADWILWLDCDDYLDEINCRRIREAVAGTPEFDALFCSYLVQHQGACIERERLIRRGYGRWKNAVHETCQINGRILRCPQILVWHRDHRAKHQSSAGRNAAILKNILADADRHYFYLQSELTMLGENTAALAAALAALALLPRDRVEERYNVLLNLSELEPDKTEQRLLEAARIQPHRREAFAYLCQRALLDGRVSDATSWFRILDALPLPSPLPWTHQGLWYGWARNYLRVKILRAAGKKELAEIEHRRKSEDPEYAAGVAEHEQPVAPA